MKMKTSHLVMCALFAALSAALSQVSIPVGPVPIVMTHISIFTAAGLLGMKYGGISQAVYVLMGAVGAPVFSGMAGGLGVVIGPRGGFIIGYVACAFLTGFIIERTGRSMKTLPFAMLPGTVVIYILGVIWYMYVTKAEPVAALTACVLPFLPGDAIKIALSSVLVNRVYPLLSEKLKAR